MNRALQPNTKFTLSFAGRKAEFEILNVLGGGGSCIAYEVSYYEDEDVLHRGVLKEYFPVYLNVAGHIQRDGTTVIVPDSRKEEFEEGLKNFRTVYKRINQYLMENPSATNYHPVQLGFCEGNNTVYTLVSRDYGKSYDQVPDEDLVSLLEVTLSVAKAVGHYHETGLLHLDIKPQNILVLDGVTDIVKLFDFDSIISMEQLQKGVEIDIPNPGVYYVPELEERNKRAIGAHTDIFEIGSMLFVRLFGRTPKLDEMEVNGDMQLEEAPFLKGVSPAVLYELKELFKHTIQIARRRRYQTTNELCSQIRKLIRLVKEDDAYLVNMPKWQPSTQQVTRKEELNELAKRLEEDGYVFVKGVGGLGKSELAKLFVMHCGDRFHTVQFYKYNGSLKMLTASLKVYGIKREDEKSMEELLQEKNRILHTSDSRTLIIVDNFNVTHDEFLRDFLPSDKNQFKVIFTTRCLIEADYYKDKVYELPALSEELCTNLFCLHCPRSYTEEELQAVRKIVRVVACHTLVVVLLAKTMRQTGISPKELLDKLERQKLHEIDTQIFHENDLSNEDIKVYNQLYGHLNVAFNVSGLDKKELEILKNMTLVSLRGMDIDEFAAFCKLSGKYPRAVIQNLVSLGWMECVSEHLIAMHPVISDMIAGNKKIKKRMSFYRLAAYLEEFCTPDYESHISVLESKLFTAIQLDKRYQKERIAKRLVMKIKLGRMYTNVYQAESAWKYLDEAEKLAKKYLKLQYLPFIYFFQGFYEEQFGTKTTAVEAFAKALSKSSWIRDWDYRRRLENESMEQIAAIHKENKEYELAFYEYRQCLWHAKLNLLFTRVDGIVDEIILICRQLGWNEKVEHYQKEKQKFLRYASASDEVTEDEKLYEELIQKGEFGNAIEVYDRILERKRKELGEDSPVYQDMQQSGWITLALRGEKEEALRGIAASLEFCEKRYGKDSMGMAGQLALIALLICEQQEFEFATDCANRAIAICEQKNEKDSYAYFQAKMALAKICSLCGKTNEGGAILADVNFESCVSNEQLADVIKNLGLLLVDLGQYDAISKMCEKLLSRKVTSKYDKFWAYIVLGEVAREKSFFKEAKEYLCKAKEYVELLKDFPKYHDILLIYYRLAGKIAYGEGLFADAIRHMDEMVALYPQKDRGNAAFATAIMERGLYYASLGDLEKSDADYSQSKKILEEIGAPKESFLVLYNNMSLNYMNKGELELAKKYLEKIVEIVPDVLTPKTQFDALVCGNLGWVLLQLEQDEDATPLLYKAMATMEELTVQQNWDYVAIVSRLFVMLLEKEQGAEAYGFAMERVELFAKHFSIYSEIYLDMLLNFASGFIEYRYSDCVEFLEMAAEILKNSELNQTVYAPRWFNFWGICEGDIWENEDEALKCFEQAKELFEDMGATDDIYYEAALANIEFVKNKQ